MAYERQYHTNGDVLEASHLNHMEAGIKENSDSVSKLSEDIADIKQNGTGTGNGLTTAQRNSLLAVVNAIGTFNVANGQELIDNFNSAWKITINATGVTLDKTTLTFVESVNQTLVATVEPSDSTDEVMWASSNESIAKVTNGIVTPISNGSCTITATAGSVSASCEVTVNVESVIVTYTVVNNLTNVSTDNPVGTITENSGYTAILTPDTDYEFDTVVVTMGGVDVTSDVYANGVIVITSVTGNIVITASAVQNGSDEEVVMLKSITGDGASYIDTEFVADNANYKYLVGVQANATYDSTVKEWFFGSRCNPFSDYKTNDIIMRTHYDDNYAYKIGIGMGRTNDVTIYFSTGMSNYDNDKDNVSRVTEVPMYVYIENGNQALYTNEDMTAQPTNGTFMNLATNLSFNDSYEMSIFPLYLCAANIDGTKAETSKHTIYCFKVWDANDNLIVDMRPAKQGGKIGMYDNVRKTFYENKGTGTFAYEELEVS